MHTFLVTMRRTLEWQQIYEAPNADTAADLAQLEAHHGTIVDEDIQVGLVEELDAREAN